MSSYDGMKLVPLPNGEFEIEKGLAKAISHTESSADYYKWTQGSRDYDTALEERITKPMENGMLVTPKKGGGFYDDRKLRFDGYRTDENGKVIIAIAPSHYDEFLAVDTPARTDPEFAEKMRARGISDFNDQSAYFVNLMATNTVPVTNEGHVHVFMRGSETKIDPNHWHVIGGTFDTEYTEFTKKDPSGEFRWNVEKNMRHELFEEAAVHYVDLELMGFVYRDIPPTTPEFVHVARLDMSSEEFLARSRKAKDADEHTGYQVLRSEKELEDFAHSDEKIVFTGRGCLLMYLQTL